MTTPTLLHLPYSPWSERARWALAARGVPATLERYQPFLGELRLRRLRPSAGPASVPVLVAGTEVLDDSTAIARWANARGAGPDLFPAAHAAELEAIVTLADTALAAGRARSLRRMAASGACLQEQVPPGLRWLGPVSRSLAGYAVRRTLRKYDGAPDDVARTALLDALDTLRELLGRRPDAAGGAKTLLPAFSYADIAATQALAFVSPPATGLRLGPETRAAFTDPYVAAVTQDLLVWRDAVYATYRGAP